MTKWMKAVSFAAHKHRHQLRRDGRTPFIAHPFRVALIVRDLFGVADEEVLAAAILHDTIEDTATDFDDIEEMFGRRVADLVSVLTKDMRLPEDEREREYDRRLAAGPWEARLIKLADVYDNISDSVTAAVAIKAGDKVARALALVENEPHLVQAADLLRAQRDRLLNVEGA